MTSIIRIKRRNAPGAAGAPSALASAELAYNEIDNTLYYGGGNSGGQATAIMPIAGPGVGAAGGFVNKLRNGTFDVWQRGASGTSTANAFTYTVDGWIIYGVGAGLVWSQVGGGGGSTWALRITGAPGVTSCALLQRIESYVAAPLAGQQVTVQAWIYNGLSSPLTPTISVTRTTAGSDNWSGSTVIDLNTALQTCAPGAWTKAAYTYAADPGSYEGLQVAFSFGALTSGFIQIRQADLRVTPLLPLGLCPNPPPPELRPISAELAFCQRYYEVHGTGLKGLAGAGGSSVSLSGGHRVTKRIPNGVLALLSVTPQMIIMGTNSYNGASSSILGFEQDANGFAVQIGGFSGVPTGYLVSPLTTPLISSSAEL